MPYQSRFIPLLLALILLAATAPSAARAQTGERCFPETGHCISGPIRAFWEQNGGLAVFGLPLGPQQEIEAEGGRRIQAQWFERHRLELHPENPAPYNVLLGRLGADRLAQQGRDWRSFPPLDPNDADAESCRFFQETNHQVCGPFLQAFRSNGLSFSGRSGVTFEESLALFGLPLSEPMTETIEGREYTVQWFERARFELHPENQPPYNVLFGRLGAELGGGQGAQPANPLEGREWRLVSFGPAGAPAAAADPAATISFAGGRVSGSTGCNSFSGGYTASDSALTFGPIASTLALCTEEALASQERAVLTALQGEAPYTVEGDTLRISYDGGRQALVYSAAPAGAGAALIGKEWRLVSFGPAGAPSPAASRPATITFDGQRAGGTTGCNGFGGSYTATETAIAFGPVISTLIACAEEDVNNQEQAVLTALQGEVPYTLAGDTLRLSYDGGNQALVFTAAPAGGAAALIGRAWQLASFGPADPVNLPAAGRPATLSFDGQRLSGSTGCNNFNGSYESAGGRLTIGPLAVTSALCTSDDLARQEAAILGALQGEAPYTVEGDTLRISYDGGRQFLTYRASGAGQP